MTGPLSLAELNGLSGEQFVAAFGDIAEHAPWVADSAAKNRPFASRDDMIRAFASAVAAAPRDRQLELLRAHPDLAGRAALAGQVAEESRREQKGAGLDSLSAEEFARFSDLNARYLKRFAFPFIFAVKGATKHQIIAGFEQRIANSRDEEFATAIAQVCKIISFRLKDRVAP